MTVKADEKKSAPKDALDDDKDDLEDEDDDSLLDDLDEDEDHEDEDEPKDKKSKGRSSADELADALEERLGTRLERMVEDKTRAALRGVRRDIRRIGKDEGPEDRRDTRKGKDQDRRVRDDDEDDRPSGDVRGARQAAREYLSDSFQFVSAEERALAMDLMTGSIASEALRGFDDEDEVGRRVATEVAARIKDLRRHYQRRTVSALKKRGALVEKEGQSAKGGTTNSPKSEWDAGAQMARDRFGSRLPAEQST